MQLNTRLLQLSIHVCIQIQMYIDIRELDITVIEVFKRLK